MRSTRATGRLQTMIFEPAVLKLHLAIGKCPSSALPLQPIDLGPLLKKSARSHPCKPTNPRQRIREVNYATSSRARRPRALVACDSPLPPSRITPQPPPEPLGGPGARLADGSYPSG